MEEELELPIIYNGQELVFPFKVVSQGYTTKFIVTIDGLEVIYEKDDEGKFRAAISKPDEFKGKLPEYKLLETISEVLQELI